MRVLKRSVRRDHKTHSGIGRQAAQNGHVGFEAPGRTSQTYHTKVVSIGACFHEMKVYRTGAGTSGRWTAVESFVESFNF